MSAGASNTPLPRKLGLIGDAVFTVLHEPADFRRTLGDIGEAVWQRNLLPPIDVIVTFHTRRVALVAEWPRLSAAIASDGGIWVAVPKPTGGLATDLDDDVVRAELLSTGWVDDKSCAIDETWSALRFVPRKDTRRRR